LNWSINVFAEAGEFILEPAKVSINNQHNATNVSVKAEATVPVVDGHGAGEILPPLSDIVDKVYQLESSGGKNVLCPAGKFNGYGYRQNKFEWVCYDNPEEPRQLVMNWFENKLKKHTLAEATCLYNSGIITEECDYFQKFKSI